MNRFELFIGIDSGPLHIAGCTNTPTIGVWTHHHPIHFFDFADNVFHMLPRDARKNIHARDKKSVDKFFQDKYRHKYYVNLKKELKDTISKHLWATSPTREEKLLISDEELLEREGKLKATRDEAYTTAKHKLSAHSNKTTDIAPTIKINQTGTNVIKTGKWWTLKPKKPILS